MLGADSQHTRKRDQHQKRITCVRPHTTTHALKQGMHASQTYPRTNTQAMRLEAAAPNVSKGAAQTTRHTTRHPPTSCRHTRRRAGMSVVPQLCHSGPPPGPRSCTPTLQRSCTGVTSAVCKKRPLSATAEAKQRQHTDLTGIHASPPWEAELGAMP